ncbi:unnamed protein product [Prorocentrum cordatum]|uniref:ER membrane protein complex subunit 6 n=1 Tax=Prorocentrum cordatum TaxID=2364126 RepID=A0ABN9ULC4_9DINO|nr:unnamed protein product [Polarella glacialis]
MVAKPAAKAAPGPSADAGKKGKVKQKEDDGEFLVMPALAANSKSLGHARVLAGAVAGCVAGLLRCEGLSGVLLFLTVTLLHSAMIYAKMGFNVTRYFQKTQDIFVRDCTHGLLPFILIWTLVYDMAHIF